MNWNIKPGSIKTGKDAAGAYYQFLAYTLKILEVLLPLCKDEQQASAVEGMLKYRGKSCQSIILAGELQLCWRVESNTWM